MRPPRANGYWDVSFEGRATYLHRLILRANVGDLATDVQARHACGHQIRAGSRRRFIDQAA